MSNGIFANNWEKVSRLIPSLGRANDFEVITAARAIGAVLKADGLDFHDLAQVIEDLIPPGQCCTAPPYAFGDIARACRDRDRGQLSPRERAFVADMVQRGFAFRPSPRQAQWLTDILDRLQAGKAAA